MAISTIHLYIYNHKYNVNNAKKDSSFYSDV